MNTAVISLEEKQAQSDCYVSLLKKIAAKYHIDAKNLLQTLKKTVFSQKNGVEATNEQLAAVLIVADKYDLNPFIREIYAYVDPRGGVIPIVGVDGWAKLVNNHPDYDGCKFAYSKETIELEGAKPCFASISCIMYNKKRNHPTVITEYLDEIYRPAYFNVYKQEYIMTPWQTHTKRLARHKAFVQCARIAFGFVGIFDQDEAEVIIENIEKEIAGNLNLTKPANTGVIELDFESDQDCIIEEVEDKTDSTADNIQELDADTLTNQIINFGKTTGAWEVAKEAILERLDKNKAEHAMLLLEQAKQETQAKVA